MSYFEMLSAVFAPIMALPPIVAELVIAAMITFVITLFYRLLVNQEKMKELREQQKELQKKSKELQKTNPEEANKVMGEALRLTNKQMRMNMKPMIPTFIIVIAILPWLAHVYAYVRVAVLPFTLPYFGNDFGWLMWYFIVSIPLTQIFRKAMGVQ